MDKCECGKLTRKILGELDWWLRFPWRWVLGLWWRKRDREFKEIMKRWPSPHNPEFCAVPEEEIRAFARKHRTNELTALRRYGYWSDRGNVWL